MSLQRRHHADQFLQEQVARGQQQVKQHQRLADAHQEGSSPVNECAGDTAGFEFHRSHLLLFFLRRAQVVHRIRRLVEACHTREHSLNPLPQLGHVFRRIVHPGHRRAAQLEETNPDGGHQEAKHDGGGDRWRNVAVGQPTDERFQGHSRHTSQEDRQDHGTGKVKEGNRAQHNQDDLDGCRFRRRGGARWSGRWFAAGRSFNRHLERPG